jgi:hypothetical protein
MSAPIGGRLVVCAPAGLATLALRRWWKAEGEHL